MLTQASTPRARRSVANVNDFASAGHDSLGPVSAWTVTAFAVTSLLWYCSFTLFAPLNIQVPALGTVTVPDIFTIAVMGLLIGSRIKNLDTLDLVAIAVGLWILIAGAVNAQENDAMDFRFFIYYQARMAPYWFALPLLRRLPYKQRRVVFISGIVIAVLVSIVHTYVLLTRNVPLLTRLYYAWYSPDGTMDPQRQYQIATQPIALIRTWPDGMTLITSVYVACLTVLASGKKVKHVLGWIAIAAICGVAALVTLTRSLGIVMLIVMPILAMIKYRSPVGTSRLLSILVMLLVAFGAAAVLSDRDLTNEYLDRFGRFSEELDPLSSPRLLDTAQGIREIAESPLFGTGLPDPRDYTSSEGKDTHGLVSLGLLGGVPLVVLTLIATYFSVTMGVMNRSWHATAGALIVLQVVILMAINTFPGFVWIRSLVPTMIGMAMCAPIGATAGLTNRGGNFRTKGVYS